MSVVLDPPSFEKKLRKLGRRYHIHHPFNQAMYSGQLTPEQIRGWVVNRYYYQINIPKKDAHFLSKCPDRQTRALWVQRILDHDGYDGGEGGIAAWERLAVSTGIDLEQLRSGELVLPAVRFAVDAYVNFVRDADWRWGATSSLTEMFAPEIHQQRLANWPKDYPWVESAGLDYFRNRLGEARRDVEHGLSMTLEYCNTAERQQKAMDTLQFKLDVLWVMSDAIHMAYVLDMPPYFNTQSLEA